MADKFGYHPGDRMPLPLAGSTHWFFVAGVWRDYARPDGAIVIARDIYTAATGDYLVRRRPLWRQSQISAAALEASIREALPPGDAVELIGSSDLREHSLTLFDRAFTITYALEVIAVAIGLAGIGVAASATALARRAQFGMLRHVGMLRRQVLAMLAGEGIIMSTLSVSYGLVFWSYPKPDTGLRHQPAIVQLEHRSVGALGTIDAPEPRTDPGLRAHRAVERPIGDEPGCGARVREDW